MSGREQIRLTRRFTLETAHTAPDGGGGFVTRWYALGTLWAAPYNASNRPKPGQRFRDANQYFHINAVTEYNSEGRYLICLGSEEVVV